MTRLRQPRVPGSEAGFSLIEMLIATLIMVTVTGAIFGMLDPAAGAFNSQPEVSDMQQRLRVGIDTLQKDLVMAGAGTYSGNAAGSLSYFFAPVMPYSFDDPPMTFRPDAISIVFVPTTPAQTTINLPMPAGSTAVTVNQQPPCPDPVAKPLCGLEEGMRVIIFNESTNWDQFAVTQVQAAAGTVQPHGGDFTVDYPAGSFIAEAQTHTYYLEANAQAETYQLMHSDGFNAALPVVDNVVALSFEYFGDKQPPTLLPDRCLVAGCVGPWTTYGPRPPALTFPSNTNYPAGENCAFSVVPPFPDPLGQHVPRLAVLGDGGIGQAVLSQAILTDGPWCPDATKPNRYDADLLRIRRIRVKMRVQVANESLRGPAGNLFKYPGTASGSKFVPDQEIRFDVSPRNLNLGR